MDAIKELLTNAGGNVVLAIVISIAGFLLIKYLMKLLRRLKGFEKLDQTMVRFILNFIKCYRIPSCIVLM